MPYKDYEKHKAVVREHYHKNPRKRKKQISKRRREIIDWFWEYKCTLKCEKCEEDHPACFDFHHRDPATKVYAVSVMPNTTCCGKDRILEEIAKCDVLCANCHRKLHYSEKLGL